ERGGDRSRLARKHLPLRNLSAHRGGGSPGGQSAEEEREMNKRNGGSDRQGRLSHQSYRPFPQDWGKGPGDGGDGHEFERYELREGPAYRFAPTRRQLLKALGGGLLILCALPIA